MAPLSPLLFLLASLLWAKEELLVVQAVSSDRTSFVVQRGAQDGVVAGQESLFTTEDASLAAVVVEISREHSLWRLSDARGTVPFDKGDTLVFTGAIDSLPLALSLGRFALGEEEREKLRELQKHPPFGKALLRSSFSFALDETVSDSASQSQRDAQRTGLQVAGLYALPLNSRVSLAFGLRFDRDTVSQEDPDLEIPTSRLFVLGEILFHLEGRNLYLGAGAGLGQSESEVGSVSVQGQAQALPIIKVGHRRALGKGRFALVSELGLEYLRIGEHFSGRIRQDTSILNGKFSLGLMF